MDERSSNSSSKSRMQRESVTPDHTGTQALWPQMISALAAIDAELGLPADGCNSTARTLAAIRELKAQAARGEALARAVMADQTGHDGGEHGR